MCVKPNLESADEVTFWGGRHKQVITQIITDRN